MFRKAIFIDEDGTLLEKVPNTADPTRITLADRAAGGIKRLVDNGYLPILIANQSGIAFGDFTVDSLGDMVDRIQELLFAEGTNISDFYFCPHHPNGTVPEYAVSCACRTPSPGMLVKAALDLRIDLANSWMVGDLLRDVEAGNRAGCRTILVSHGSETKADDAGDRKPDFVVTDMNQAADVILQNVSLP